MLVDIEEIEEEFSDDAVLENELIVDVEVIDDDTIKDSYDKENSGSMWDWIISFVGF